MSIFTHQPVRPDFVAAGLITAHSKATNHPATFSHADFIGILQCAIDLHWEHLDGAEGPVASTMDLWHGADGVEHRFSVIVC